MTKPDLTNTAPKRIYLDIGDQFALERVASGDLRWDLLDGVTWSEDNATSHGIPYVRADLVTTPAASGAAPATEPDTCDAEGNHIGVVAGFARHKYRQGTRACVAFVNGARWWHEVAALASPQVAPAPEAEICPHCDGSGDQVYMSNAGPDAYEEIGPCEHCSGAGTLAAAYTGVKALLERSRTSFREASAVIWHARDEPAAHQLRNIADYVIDPKMSPVWVRDRLNALADMALATPVQVAPPNLSSPLAGDCRTVGGFLSDVMTAAGLVEHGRQCKPLAERISVACSDLRARIFQGSAPVAPQDDARDAAEAIDAELPAYPTGDVIGPCVCGSWPGGPCLKCPAAKPTGEQS